jgi:hypothetical protein
MEQAAGRVLVKMNSACVEIEPGTTPMNGWFSPIVASAVLLSVISLKLFVGPA